MAEALIFDHVRTPRGKGRDDGALREIAAVQLTAQTLGNLAERNKLDTGLLDDVVLGCVQTTGEQGGNIARAAVLEAGYSQSVGGQQVHRFCASGLDAINIAAAQIGSDGADAVVAGGVESMSRIFLGADSGAWTSDPSVAYNTYFAPQGIGADLIATLDNYSREDIDAYALLSQKRAAHAWQSGYFSNSIAPVRDVLGEIILDTDEHMRPDVTAEQLAGLPAAFEALGNKGGFDGVALQKYPEVEAIRHVHTAGSSSGIVDGAAAMLIGNKSFAASAGLKARARIRSFASIGSEPTIMLTAPAAVAEKALRRAGMAVSDIDLFEINEAFASVVMRFTNALQLDMEKVNVNGGAIAMGHPLGATGAMIAGTVLDELERRDLHTALVTLCAGNGLGTATIIERI
ncbi:MAG: acetyl-CoA C-acetyltransferase [Nitratireductor sp.]|nr:acetyl-CoA C-acetyltransferase [Nitratireductor sp.]